MRKNRIISLILAVVLCLTATVLVVTANTKEASIQIASDKTELKAGEATTVSVNVTTNFSVATMSIPVFYDKTMVTVSEATATLTDYAVKSTTTDVQSVNSEKVYADTNIDSDKYGFVLVTYIASAGSDVSAAIDGTVLTFKVTANTDVEGDALFNCVAETAKTADNVDGMLYFGSPTSGNTINSVPENVENINFDSASETVVITKGSAEANTLIVEENFEYSDYVVIDKNNTNNGEYTGIVYGIDTLDQNEMMESLGALDDALTTNNGDDYLVIEANENGMESTGATITVVDENGDPLETYVFVYFGDVDMDGMISANDAYIAEYYEASYEGVDSYAQYVSADIDGDGMPSANDAYIMEYYEASYEGVDYQYNLGQNAVNNTYEWVY